MQLLLAATGCLALHSRCRCLDTRAIHFTQPGSLAFEATEIEQLGAAHLVGAYYLNFIQDRGVEGEDTLDTLAKADLAHRETPLGPVAFRDKRAFKGLNAFLVASLRNAR